MQSSKKQSSQAVAVDDSVSVWDRFKEPLAWPILATVLVWLVAVLLYSIELGQTYFINWSASAIGFTIALGVLWVAWTACFVYDQLGGQCEAPTKEGSLTTADKRAPRENNTLWASFILSSIFTISLVIFMWIRLKSVENDIGVEITSAEDVLHQITSWTNVTAPLVNITEIETFALALQVESILQFEAIYMICAGTYTVFFGLLAFFAVTSPEDEKEKRKTY